MNDFITIGDHLFCRSEIAAICPTVKGWVAVYLKGIERPLTVKCATGEVFSSLGLPSPMDIPADLKSLCRDFLMTLCRDNHSMHGNAGTDFCNANVCLYAKLDGIKCTTFALLSTDDINMLVDRYIELKELKAKEETV